MDINGCGPMVLCRSTQIGTIVRRMRPRTQRALLFKQQIQETLIRLWVHGSISNAIPLRFSGSYASIRISDRPLVFRATMGHIQP